MNELSNELEWLHLYLLKITLFIKQSTVITNELQRLLDSIRLLDHFILSPALVSTETLTDMVKFI